MKLELFQVDSFTSEVFKGNPAAVCPLKEWLGDHRLQAVAAENNLSETAFFVPVSNGYHIRWFTPTSEVELCGHATLASAYVLWEFLNYVDDKISFQSRSGELAVLKSGTRYTLDFPSRPAQKIEASQILIDGLGASPLEIHMATDCLAVFDSVDAIRRLSPNFEILNKFEARGILATAKGDDCDFVSRCFYPRVGVPEDPVTGSAHCTLAPYWAEKLNKATLFCRQISARGGELWCEVKGDRVEISGNCVLYLRGHIEI